MGSGLLAVAATPRLRRGWSLRKRGRPGADATLLQVLELEKNDASEAVAAKTADLNGRTCACSVVATAAGFEVEVVPEDAPLKNGRMTLAPADIDWSSHELAGVDSQDAGRVAQRIVDALALQGKGRFTKLKCALFLSEEAKEAMYPSFTTYDELSYQQEGFGDATGESVALEEFDARGYYPN